MLANRNGVKLCSPHYGFIKNLSQIHLRNIHRKVEEKNEVDNTT